MTNTVIIAGSGHPDVATAATLKAALDAAENGISDRFVIIERADETYMQCLVTSGWRLEKREGDKSNHYVASRHDKDVLTEQRLAFLAKIADRGEALISKLDRNDVEDAMIAYMSGQDNPHWLIWSRITV
ncbi:hypothetical protein [uncultured Sphingomonas sp.]|uniref:hypothetical protein n=1 Tax=uncultured Sphingomonas sp. TaxID=158754 RepID=UPI0035CBFFBE